MNYGLHILTLNFLLFIISDCIANEQLPPKKSVTKISLADVIRSKRSSNSQSVTALSNIQLLHWQSPNQMEFSEDETVLFTSSSKSSTLRLWDTKTGQLLNRFVNSSPFFRFALIEGGKKVLTLDDPNFSEQKGILRVAPLLRIWDSISGKQIKSKPLPIPWKNSDLSLDGLALDEKSQLVFIAYSHTGEGIITNVLVKKISTLKKIANYRIPNLKHKMSHISVSPQSHLLLVHSKESLVVLDSLTGKERWQYRPNQGLNFIRDSQFIHWEFYPNSLKNTVLVIESGKNKNSKKGEFIVLDAKIGKVIKIKESEWATLLKRKANWRSNSWFSVRAKEPLVLAFNDRNQRVELNNLSDLEQPVVIELLRDIHPTALTERLQKNKPRNLSSNIIKKLYQSPSSTAWSKSGRLYAICFEDDHRIRLFDLKEGCRVSKSSESIRTATNTPDGQFIAAIAGTSILRIETSQPDKQKKFYGPGQIFTCVALSADGRYCVAGGKDRTVELWDFSSGRHIASLVGHYAEVIEIAISNDGKRITSGDNKGRILTWLFDDNTKRYQQKSIRLIKRNYSLLIAGQSWSELRKSDTNGVFVPPLIALSKYGDHLSMLVGPFSDSLENELDVRPQLQVKNPIKPIQLDGKEFYEIGMGKWWGVIKIHNIQTGKEKIFNPRVPPKYYLNAIRYSPNGKTLAMLFNNGQIRLFNDKQKLLAILRTGKKKIQQVKVMNHFVLLGRPNGEIEIWNTKTLKRIYTKHIDDCHLTSLDWYQNKKEFGIVIGTKDRGVLLHKTGNITP